MPMRILRSRKEGERIGLVANSEPDGWSPKAGAVN